MAKYGLTAAPTKSLGLCNTFDHVCDNMYIAYQDAVIGSIDKNHEGSLIYLVKRCDKVLGDRILSISRAECIEFIIL